MISKIEMAYKTCALPCISFYHFIIHIVTMHRPFSLFVTSGQPPQSQKAKGEEVHSGLAMLDFVPLHDHQQKLHHAGVLILLTP